MLKRLFIKLINYLASKYATEICWHFDTQEARGTVQVIKSGYGAYLNFPEILETNNAAVLGDLFYRSPEGKGLQPGNPYCVHVYHQNDLNGDPIYQEMYY